MSQTPSKLKRRNLPLLLLQVREGVFSRFRPVLNQADVTEQQWRVLRALLEQGPLEPREIGRICCISSASLARILALMDELGLVSRERFEHDQRRVLVSVTPRANQLAAGVLPRIETAYRALESDLGVELSDELYRVLDRVQIRLEQLSGTAPLPDA